MPDDRTPDREVFESVPWEHLVDLRPDRRRWLYVGAGMVVVAGLVAGIVMTFRPGPEAITVAPEPAPATAGTPDTADPTPVTTAGPVPAEPVGAPPSTGVLPGPGVYSEADLMAGSAGGVPSSLAAPIAEWFVVEWFTIDGDPSSPTWPWPGAASRPAGDGIRSFVEWVGAVKVEEVEPGVQAVDVVVRRLAATDGATYRRIPTEAVRVVVDLTGSGPVVRDLPRPVSLPQGTTGGAGEWGDPVEDPPAGMLEAAAGEVGARSIDVQGMWSVGDRWRAVVGVADAGGTVWPVAVWLDGEGHRTGPMP